MEVVVGTYDHLLCSLRFCSGEDDNPYRFQAAFSYHGHGGCVKAVACSDRILASGSADETIRLFDLKQRVELGSLNQQEGTISCLAFCNDSHMLSGSEDGTICVWECKSWDCMKVLKGHREGVTSLSVHPTGRLALSVSKDKTLRTWNLLTGRSAYVTNIKQVATIVLWSPSGETYAVATTTQVIVYKVSTAALVYTIEATSMVLALSFLESDFLAVSGEMRHIEIHDVKLEKCVQSLTGHKARVKGLSSVKNQSNSDDKRMFLLSVSSDGVLIAWSFHEGKYNEKPDLLCTFELTGRPTCMAVFTGESRSNKLSKPEKETGAKTQAVAKERNERKHPKTETGNPLKSKKRKKAKIPVKK